MVTNVLRLRLKRWSWFLDVMNCVVVAVAFGIFSWIQQHLRGGNVLFNLTFTKQITIRRRLFAISSI